MLAIIMANASLISDFPLLWIANGTLVLLSFYTRLTF